MVWILNVILCTVGYSFMVATEDKSGRIKSAIVMYLVLVIILVLFASEKGLIL